MASRRLRAFKRWMSANSIKYSDALDLVELEDGSICVKSNCDLKEGDLVATIPKRACLTVRTSGAAALIEASGLDGSLALSIAVMYERSLDAESPWAGYLQLLPFSEPLPLVWTLEEVDSLLRGTELHKVWF
uniref:SET domain-containing protein n=2 Tax=Opuntia streptacantha TaxID=393608 RepID=A0A7C9FGT2_OPUST